MYSSCIKMLKQSGVQIERGLTDEELFSVQKIYGVQFPEPLKEFLKAGLPISKGFYNWRDTREQNVQYIKRIIAWPVKSICDLPQEVDWCDAWGDEPEDKQERENIIKYKAQNSPVLLPIFYHRFMPTGEMKEYPVLSINGSDVIYYGKNLENYLQIEFGNEKQSDLDYSDIEYVPFWSDLM